MTAVVKITQEGRWSYSFYILDGIGRYAPRMGGCWSVYGSRARAERKAARQLRKYREMKRRLSERATWELT